MSRRKRLIIVIIIGILSWIIAYNIDRKKTQKQIKKKEITVVKKEKKLSKKMNIYKKVVVARRDIKKGNLISKNDVYIKNIEKKNLITGYITSIDTVINKIALDNIKKDTQMTRRLLLDIKNTNRLSYFIPTGYRAIAIKISNPQYAVSGFLKQGEYIDIIAVFGNKRVVDIPLAKTIIENARLLAVGNVFYKEGEKDNKTNNKKEKKNNEKIESQKITYATLAVRKEDAKKIALLDDSAKFYLTLRSPFDDTVNKRDKAITQADILGFMKGEDIIKSKEDRVRINSLNRELNKITIFKGTENINTVSVENGNSD